MKVTVLNGQTILDIALQELGDVSGAYDIATLNGLDLTEDIKPGTVLELPEVINKSMVNYYKTNNIKPATGFNT